MRSAARRTRSSVRTSWWGCPPPWEWDPRCGCPKKAVISGRCHGLCLGGKALPTRLPAQLQAKRCRNFAKRLADAFVSDSFRVWLADEAYRRALLAPLDCSKTPERLCTAR